MVGAARRRPWYLLLALLGALALGTTGACGAWNTVSLYHGQVEPSVFAQGIGDEADRLAVMARFQSYLHVLDAARSRAWPLAVASLLLGGAVFVAAMRALGGSGGARSALVQLVIAQAGTSAASYWLTRDVFEANLRLVEARGTADLHERILDRPVADEQANKFARQLRAAIPVEFALGSLSSALIVVALTRRRSRDFLEGTKETVKEP